MTNEHDPPDQNKPIPTDCDAATISLTRRESLLLAEMLENPPPRNAAFLRAQDRCRSLKSTADPLYGSSRRIGIVKGLLDVPDDIDACNEEIVSLFENGP